MNTELVTWKEKLEKEKEDLQKRKAIIEARLNKSETLWKITQEVSADQRGKIAKEAEKSYRKFQQELEDFNKTNAPQLKEIDAILTVLHRKGIENH